MSKFCSKDSAKSLAVAYEAFNEAKDERNDNGVMTWGYILKSSQDESGVVLYPHDTLDILINGAKRRLGVPTSDMIEVEVVTIEVA